MELRVDERLVLLSTLPTEGSLTTIKIVKDLRNDLSFTEAEHQVLNFREENDQVMWDLGVDEVDIDIGPKAHVLIADLLTDLADNEKLTEGHLAVYDKFVE